MAAEVINSHQVSEQETIIRLKRECDQLRRKYAGLENAHRQAIERLEQAEASKSDFEQRRANELFTAADRIREKIQSLELRQLQAGDDFEEFKQQLKYDLTRQYQEALDELIGDVEQQRRVYSDLRLQHSILKSEFETMKTAAENQDHKLRLKLSNQAKEFDAERTSLQARIDQLSSENAKIIATTAATANGEKVDAELVKSLRNQLGDMQKQYGRLETEFEKYQAAKEGEIEELKQQLADNEEEKRTALAIVRQMEAEIIEEQRKRESTDHHYSRAHRDLLQVREENEVLRRRLEMQADEFNAQFSENRVQLEKQRDENSIKIEDLERQVTQLKEQKNKLESLYHRTEMQLAEAEKLFMRELEKEKEAWRNEKITIETKIRDLQRMVHDAERVSQEKLQETQLALKKSLWEKEKLAEDLARLNSNKEARSTEKAKTGPDQSSLLNRLSEQERKFTDLENAFARYRQKQDQFRDVLELVNAQIDRTVNTDDGDDAQALVDDLKRKVEKLLVPQHMEKGNALQKHNDQARKREDKRKPKAIANK